MRKQQLNAAGAVLAPAMGWGGLGRLQISIWTPQLTAIETGSHALWDMQRTCWFVDVGTSCPMQSQLHSVPFARYARPTRDATATTLRGVTCRLRPRRSAGACRAFRGAGSTSAGAAGFAGSCTRREISRAGSWLAMGAPATGAADAVTTRIKQRSSAGSPTGRTVAAGPSGIWRLQRQRPR